MALALGTAITFALSAVLVRVGVEKSTPLSALFVTLSVNLVVLWTLSWVRYEVSFDVWNWRHFVIAGLFAPVLGRLCNYTGIQRLGVNLSVPISNANPMVAVVLAFVFLGEALSPFGLVGAAGAIAGGMLLGTVRGGERYTVNRRDFVFPVLAAMLFGGAQVLRKVGLDLVAAPAVGAAVNTTTSWALVVIYLTLTGNYRQLELRNGVGLFVLSGLASSTGIVFLYMALQGAPVVLVAPILNASPLFALVLSAVFTRELEMFTPRVTVGTVLVVAGITALVLAS
ncbi:DMT family transporter [Salinigranum rubrum]|nr:EamA family transporter [Salinigranum rubrum]